MPPQKRGLHLQPAKSQIWYGRALKSDPNHVLTWQYYGHGRAHALFEALQACGLESGAGTAARLLK
jgi:hypothetical protein